jgi:hypothetical protein
MSDGAGVRAGSIPQLRNFIGGIAGRQNREIWHKRMAARCGLGIQSENPVIDRVFQLEERCK